MTTKGMNLKDKMDKYETVKSDNCKSCGNPSFFKKDDVLECTTCGADSESSDDCDKVYLELHKKLHPNYKLDNFNIKNILKTAQANGFRYCWLDRYLPILLANKELLLTQIEYDEEIKQLQQKITKLEKDNAMLVEALEFYEIGTDCGGKDGLSIYSGRCGWMGDVAQETLTKLNDHEGDG